MSDYVQSLLTIAETVKKLWLSQPGLDFELYSQAQDVDRLARALRTIEAAALRGNHSQIDIKFYCYGDAENGDMVDYEMNGFDAEGYEESIISDLNASSFIQAIIEMADNLKEDKEL